MKKILKRLATGFLAFATIVTAFPTSAVHAYETQYWTTESAGYIEKVMNIRCEISLGKYQDQLLRLEDKLESGLYCELIDKTLHDGYDISDRTYITGF